MSAAMISADLQNVAGVKLEEFTPLAMLVTEDLCIGLNPQGRIKTIQQLVEEMKKDPEQVRLGFSTAIGTQNHIAIALLAEAIGVDIKKLRTAVFKSAGEIHRGAARQQYRRVGVRPRHLRALPAERRAEPARRSPPRSARRRPTTTSRRCASSAYPSPTAPIAASSLPRACHPRTSSTGKTPSTGCARAKTWQGPDEAKSLERLLHEQCRYAEIP